MDIYTKVDRGTPRHDQAALCATCRSAQRISGDTLDEQFTLCHVGEGPPKRITFQVRECSRYSDERLPSLYDMRDSAWILRTEANRRVIGFVPSKKLSEEEKKKLDEDLDL